MWILGKAWRDGVFLLFPGVLAFGLLHGVVDYGGMYPVIAFLAFGFVDSGHGVTTAWRTWWHQPERERTSLYWKLPLAVFVLVTGWVYFQVPFLWTAIIVVSVYHFLRQYVGVLRWYEKLNHRGCRHSKKFLYVLSLLPMAISGFRPSNPLMEEGFYGSGDMIHASSAAIFHGGLALYALTLALWLAFEIFLWRRGIRETNRALAIASPALVYGLCFLLGNTYGQMLFPVLIAHGVPYFALLSLSLERTQRGRFPRMSWAVGAVLLTALCYGLFEYFVAEGMLGLDQEEYLERTPSLFYSILVGLYVLPTLCHYLFDGVIWRRDHWEAKTVYQSSPPQSIDKAA